MLNLFIQLFSGVSSGNIDPISAVLIIVAVVVSLCAALVSHEVAHGYVALANGDNTAKLFGRLSVNPARHFTPVGFLMMVLVGFGWAKPVPVDPSKFRNPKKGNITVAVAGIAANLVLAFLFTLVYVLIGSSGAAGSAFFSYVLEFFYYLTMFFVMFSLNFALFNLLPFFPLDGYRLLTSFISPESKVAIFLRRYSMPIMLVLLFIGMVPFLEDYSPLTLYISFFRDLITRGFEGFWRLIFGV